jgi:hypothetical protein
MPVLPPFAARLGSRYAKEWGTALVQQLNRSDRTPTRASRHTKPHHLGCELSYGAQFAPQGGFRLADGFRLTRNR